MKQYKDQAIVLSRVDYGERDRILTLLCREVGKVSVLAKSVRSAKSRLAGGIELLSESEVNFIEGRTSLKTLTAARLLHYYSRIVGDMRRMNLAFSYIKGINTITEEGTGAEYYQPLSLALQALNDEIFDASIVDIWFSLQIMKISGSEPNLNLEDSDQAENFSFNYDKQQFQKSEGGPFSKNDLKLLRLCLTMPAPPRIKNRLGSEDRLQALVSTLLKSNVTEV